MKVTEVIIEVDGNRFVHIFNQLERFGFAINEDFYPPLPMPRKTGSENSLIKGDIEEKYISKIKKITGVVTVWRHYGEEDL